MLGRVAYLELLWRGEQPIINGLIDLIILSQVDAQNKFMGKSFEIRPTGVAHAELLIPETWAANNDYAKAKGGPRAKGKVVEHYSWKKVTTNVSGFILGSPTIDHYGDMIVSFSFLCGRVEFHAKEGLARVDHQPSNQGSMLVDVQTQGMAR
jgi:hypothetical protein